MVYAAIALALVGVAVGLVFRLKILLSVLALLLVVSVVFSLDRGFSFLDTALTIMVVQTILQGSYFLGLVIRAVFTSSLSHAPGPLRLRHPICIQVGDQKSVLLFLAI